MAKEETEVASEFARFLHGSRYYAWIEVPVAMLEIPIPDNTGVREAELWGKKNKKPKLEADKTKEEKQKEKDTGEIAETYDMKTVGEFLFPASISIDGSTALVPLIPQQWPKLRQKAVTEADLASWVAYLSDAGIAFEDWLDVTQYRARVESPMYSTDVDN